MANMPGDYARLSEKQKWICVPRLFDYKERLWRGAFGFRALIFLPPPFLFA
jgi:hypothetical protein